MVWLQLFMKKNNQKGFLNWEINELEIWCDRTKILARKLYLDLRAFAQTIPSTWNAFALLICLVKSYPFLQNPGGTLPPPVSLLCSLSLPDTDLLIPYFIVVYAIVSAARLKIKNISWSNILKAFLQSIFLQPRRCKKFTRAKSSYLKKFSLKKLFCRSAVSTSKQS